MATVVVQYVIHPGAAKWWMPETNTAVSNHSFVTAIKGTGDDWGLIDRDGSLFSFVTRDLTLEQQGDLLIGKKAINRMNPSGPLLPVNKKDQRNVARKAVNPNS